jgi:hypothetical protein
MIKVRAFKEKRKERDNEKPPTWWPMEGSKLDGQIGKHLCLVAIGRRNRSIFFTSYFSP